MGPQGATRATLLSGLAQSGDLGRGKEGGGGAAEGRSPAPVGHCGVWEEGPERGQKAPGQAQALGGPACPPPG
jgi:hypothetical protein